MWVWGKFHSVTLYVPGHITPSIQQMYVIYANLNIIIVTVIYSLGIDPPAVIQATESTLHTQQTCCMPSQQFDHMWNSCTVHTTPHNYNICTANKMISMQAGIHNCSVNKMHKVFSEGS